ncbi:hypothetical protein [Roseovarius aestuarii]|uniref:Uncharacterized protein n=1 Tax=Roseovarius aestuarii TaxID=475083 RepID=A0A1X7BWL7_9RHOB|nr:hypothetical protein [Roseovarius aestuarii]SMC13994.1 hypothetical protein ROA7745_03856 [Roseovarius aestuarii]
MAKAAIDRANSENLVRAHGGNLKFSLRALAARKMPQIRRALRQYAAEKPAIWSRSSIDRAAKDQDAGDCVEKIFLA